MNSFFQSYVQHLKQIHITHVLGDLFTTIRAQVLLLKETGLVEQHLEGGLKRTATSIFIRNSPGLPSASPNAIIA